MKKRRKYVFQIFTIYIVILLLSYACSSLQNQPVRANITPTHKMVTPQFTASPLRPILTLTAAPTATTVSPLCISQFPFIDDIEFIEWFGCVITDGDVEDLLFIVPNDGITLAPSNQGCPTGDCFPSIYVDEFIRSIFNAQLSIGTGEVERLPVCYGYSATERQLTITYRDLSLSFSESIDNMFYESAGFEFVFWRNPEAPTGYEMSMIIGVIPEFIEDHRGGSSEFNKACP